MDVTNASFVQNSAGSFGGAVFGSDAQITASGAVFAENTAVQVRTPNELNHISCV